MHTMIHLGTSGWQYDHWRESFYGQQRKADWLRFYATHFNSVEINSTFYRLQSATTLSRWYHSTPADFTFSIKAHRYLTHSKRLLDPQAAIIRERDNARPLRQKLQAVVWQLPASLHGNISRLQDFTRALHRWRSVRHVIEFRHPSWFTAEVAGMLESRGIANCISDAGDWPCWDRVCGDLAYVRLHGRPRTYASSYGSKRLLQWAQRLLLWQRQGKQVFLYFDNDAEGFAVSNALRLRDLLQ